MKLQEGRVYRTKNGTIVGPAIKRDESNYPFICSEFTYTNDGNYVVDKRDHSFNIVSEVVVVEPEFLREIHDNASDKLKAKLEDKFPYLGEPEKYCWYFVWSGMLSDTKLLIYYQGYDVKTYGWLLNDDVWFDGLKPQLGLVFERKATKQEVEKMFDKQATKLYGADWRNMDIGNETYIPAIYVEPNTGNSVWCDTGQLFNGQKWYEPQKTAITELTLKEVADKFGVPLDKLRIKE